MGGSFDTGMLELFCTEAASHAAALESGLPELESSVPTPDKIEPLIRAARSIKGAARIVGLDEAVDLAHLMEDCLAKAGSGSLPLGEDTIDALLRGAGFFKRIAGEAPERIPGWISEHAEERAEIEAAARAVLSGDKPRETASAEKPGEEMREGPPAPGSSSDSPMAVGDTPAVAPNRHPAPEAEGPPPEDAPANEPPVDTSMLELFCMEAASNASLLESGLLEMEAAAGDPHKIEPLMRAAHSIKGAARIVGLSGLVGLAHGMEDLLVAAQAASETLHPDAADTLLRGADVFKRVSSERPERIPVWIREHGGEIEEIEAELRSVLAGDRKASGESATEPAPEQEPPRGRPAGGEPGAAAEGSSAGSPPTSPETRLQTHRAAPPGAEPEPVSDEGRTAIPVTAENLGRLMGMAGECLVESRHLQTYVQRLHELKGEIADLSLVLSSLRENLGSEGDGSGAMKILTEALQKNGSCREALSSQLDSLEMYLLRWENLSHRLYSQAVSTKMRPFRDAMYGFPRMVRDLARSQGKKIRLFITGENTLVDRDVLTKLDAPLTHILRNACDHGVEPPADREAAGKPAEAAVHLEVVHKGGMLSVTVSDDGRGIDPERIRQKVVERGLAAPEMAESLSEPELMDFLFLSGFSTSGEVTEVSGRGVGLDVVHNMVQEIRGTVNVFSQPGQGTAFHLKLPLTLSVIRTLLVEIAGEAYAFPLTRVDSVSLVTSEQVTVMEDRQYFHSEGDNIGLVAAHEPLRLGPPETSGDGFPVVVMSDRLNRYGVVVDRFLGERELVVRPLDPRLGKVPNVSAAAVTEEGAPVLILDVDDLVRSIDNMLTGRKMEKIGAGRRETARRRTERKRVLVVDDSITVREVERKILENRGYNVEVAVDGMDGWNAVRSGNYDLVISDVDMPRMNGIEMVENIRKDPSLEGIPVVVVSYKDREEDRIRGMEAGADYYLTKSSFYDESFLEAVLELIGEP
jgi:two-component system sensor histidine kinase and response regulator WspE